MFVNFFTADNWMEKCKNCSSGTECKMNVTAKSFQCQCIKDYYRISDNECRETMGKKRTHDDHYKIRFDLENSVSGNARCFDCHPGSSSTCENPSVIMDQVHCPLGVHSCQIFVTGVTITIQMTILYYISRTFFRFLAKETRVPEKMWTRKYNPDELYWS
jgi:hypothetical protein